MIELTKKKMMSAIEPHMECEEPLRSFNINNISIPHLVIKDDDRYYFSELKYRETTYNLDDRQVPLVEFDFEFTYDNEVIKEHCVNYMEIAYKKCMQEYKNVIFEKEDLNDMYLVFYKNRRHDGYDIYNVSVYHNMKKVVELKDFIMFCDDNSDMDFSDFSYTKILEGGCEETWRVTDFINEELEDRYDPWEDAKQKQVEEEAEVEAVFSMDYEELKKTYLQSETEIREKMYSIIGQTNWKDDSNRSVCLIDEEEMKRAFQVYISRNITRLEPPSSAGTNTYELTQNEINNDKCMVFENGVIIDYIHLSTNAEAEWDRNDYYKASHYAEDCRFIRIDGVTFDLFNPRDIMNIPIGESKISEHLFESFVEMVGYNKYDLKLLIIRETETDRFNEAFWSNSEIEQLADLIRNQGETVAIGLFTDLTCTFCKTNEILLTKSDLNELVELYAFVVKKYVVDKQVIDCGTPAWCIEYLRSINPELEVEQYESEEDDIDILMDFWDYDRSIDFVKMIESDGLDVASDHYLNLASDYCEENQIEIDPDRFIEHIMDMLGISDDEDDDDFDEEYDDEDEDYDEEDEERNELYDLLRARTTGCFEPALLVPLAHITVNMAIKDGAVAYGCERIVAQLVANGEDEYGKQLDEELSKRDQYWNENESVPYGVTLKSWAINAREYRWLSDNFPDLVPRSKGAYTTAKRSLNKKYLALKEKAAEKGYILDDNT